MKRAYIIIIALILTGSVVYLRLVRPAPETSIARPALQTPIPAQTPPLEKAPKAPKDYAFKVGERFTYVIAWQGIPIGEATSTVEAITTYKGYEVYKIVVRAGTNDFLSAIFKIRDSFISYMDTETLESRCFEVSLREGGYKKDLVVDYDWDNRIATYQNLTDGSIKKSALRPGARDPVCASYYFRTLPLNPDEHIVLGINASEKNYEIGGTVIKEAKITVPQMGKFDAFLVEPYVKQKGEYENRVSVKGYVSQEPNRILLLIKMQVLELIPWLGEVTAKLEKIEYITPAQD
ncbi:MAG: DUF3108 domain-containing protein [Candidatus Omnitrophica bacterium]|nr:DUF3108 domain-containing protein [Candidatus Omnitrophota bacterium]